MDDCTKIIIPPVPAFIYMEQRSLLTYIAAGLVLVTLVLALFTFAVPYDTDETRVLADETGEDDDKESGSSEKGGEPGGGESDGSNEESQQYDDDTWDNEQTGEGGEEEEEKDGGTNGRETEDTFAEDDSEEPTDDEATMEEDADSDLADSDDEAALSNALDESEADADSEYNTREEKNYLSPIFMLVTIVLIVITLIGFNLVARIEDGVALNGIRRDIFEYIKHNPGEHMRSIMHEFDLSSSATQYHLKVLEDTRQVVSHREAKFKRFYINGGQVQGIIQDRGYKEMIGAMKNQTTRQVVRFLMKYPGSNQKQISEALGLHPSTVNWHAERLVKARLLKKEKRGREMVYILSKEEALRKTLDVVEPGS